MQYYMLYYYVGVRGLPERDISSLGAMGRGGWRFEEILPSPPPPSSSSSSPPSGGGRGEANIEQNMYYFSKFICKIR